MEGEACKFVLEVTEDGIDLKEGDDDGLLCNDSGLTIEEYDSLLLEREG
jgi:hypothetical protein